MAMQKSVSGAVLVTGASSGIGKACAFHLHELGFKVFAGVQTESERDKIMAKASPMFTPVLMDVTDLQSISSAFDIISNLAGESGLVGLVNNVEAGCAVPLELIPIPDLRLQLEVNIIGPIAVTQKFLPLLQPGRGRIVNIGSVSGVFAEPLLGLYSASKYAIEAFSDSIRLELRPKNIFVSLIEPGTVSALIWERTHAKTREFMENLSPAEHHLYGDRFKDFFETMEKASNVGLSTEIVANAAAHALISKHPKTRYALGPDPKLMAKLIKFLPAGIRDLVKTSLMNFAENYSP